MECGRGSGHVISGPSCQGNGSRGVASGLPRSDPTNEAWAFFYELINAVHVMSPLSLISQPPSLLITKRGCILSYLIRFVLRVIWLVTTSYPLTVVWLNWALTLTSSFTNYNIHFNVKDHSNSHLMGQQKFISNHRHPSLIYSSGGVIWIINGSMATFLWPRATTRTAPLSVKFLGLSIGSVATVSLSSFTKQPSSMRYCDYPPQYLL